MKRTTLLFALIALLQIQVALAATTLTGVTVSPANPRVGEEVKITVNGTVESANCGIRMEFGSADLPREEFILSDKGGQLPLTISKTYTNPAPIKSKRWAAKWASSPLVAKVMHPLW